MSKIAETRNYQIAVTNTATGELLEVRKLTTNFMGAFAAARQINRTTRGEIHAQVQAAAPDAAFGALATA